MFSMDKSKSYVTGRKKNDWDELVAEYATKSPEGSVNVSFSR